MEVSRKHRNENTCLTQSYQMLFKVPATKAPVWFREIVLQWHQKSEVGTSAVPDMSSVRVSTSAAYFTGSLEGLVEIPIWEVVQHNYKLSLNISFIVYFFK